MKRTELTRSTRLQATTRLKTAKPLVRRAPMPKDAGLATGRGLDRATASPIGREVRKAMKKRYRRTGPGPEVMAILADRSGGMCEIGVICLGRNAATDPSHRLAKGMGGTKDPCSNTAANNLHACRCCHDAVEREPQAAYARGWKIRRGAADPREVAVRHWVHGWVFLDDMGGWTSAEVAS
ncbi:MAG TPA: hypothetical protein VIS29_08595 [Streptomyces sp.]